uniref:Uncharacterized protein n=1 Tax=Tanacetum cinerariifolium TaxID=118510 RepID=A0A699IXI4_TANCI|nr:hypothetical protein [Tanacetum cinerariifolium]
MSPTTVLVVTKHVQSMSSSVTPMRRYGNPASGYESYMLAAHSELPNSTQWIVPKPFGKLSELSHSSIDPLEGHWCYLLNSLCWVHPNIPNAIANLLGSLASDRGIHRADEPIVCSMTSCRSRSSRRALPHLYLDVRTVRHNLLRGGNSASKVSSLRSTGDGMDSEAGNGGNGDNDNGNDVEVVVVVRECSDDGGGGSGVEMVVEWVRQEVS